MSAISLNVHHKISFSFDDKKVLWSFIIIKSIRYENWFQTWKMVTNINNILNLLPCYNVPIKLNDWNKYANLKSSYVPKFTFLKNQS